MDTLPTLLQPSHLDPLKPSLFELLSEQQLSSLLAPTLRYLLALLTHRRPRYLLRVLNNFDEVYGLLSVVVERYYLTNFGGAFTEHFYGLKRERVLSVRGGEVRRAQLKVPREVGRRLKLDSFGVWRNLAVLVGVPYLKRKLDEAYDIHVAPGEALRISAGGEGPRYRDRDALPPHPTFRQRVMYYYKWFLRRCYPSINAAYYLAGLAFALGYLFDGTKYSSPWLWLVGTRMRRMGAEDYRAIEEMGKVVPTAPGRPGQGLAGILHPSTLYPRLLSSLRMLLPASIFALKFLEWWHASDFSRQLSRKAAQGLDLPPPVVSGLGLARTVKKPEEGDERKKLANVAVKRDPPVSSTSYLPILTVPPPPSSDLCPICLCPIKNPAACQTGHVFDYKCIFQWIEGVHERQESWMRGDQGSEWEESVEGVDDEEKGPNSKTRQSREGRWESGQGRCAITGRRVLGGTSGLRRVMV